MATLTHGSASVSVSPTTAATSATPARRGLSEEQKTWYAFLYYLFAVALACLTGLVALLLV